VTRRTLRRCVLFFLVAAAIAAIAPGVAAQLASRPVGEWQRVLDSPERLAGLRIDEVVARLALKPTDVVADLGAGTGPFAVAMARAVPSGRVYAVEVDAGFLPIIADRARTAGASQVQPILGAFGDPTLPSAVDVAFMHDVLHHIADRPAYVKALVKYLQPGARVAIVDYQPERSPHQGQRGLVVSKEDARQLFAGVGLKVTEDIALFDDKWFLVFSR
jgi:cyclopropane fatty-acyl-phospholipid synthase-like methyltransferase